MNHPICSAYSHGFDVLFFRQQGGGSQGGGGCCSRRCGKRRGITRSPSVKKRRVHPLVYNPSAYPPPSIFLLATAAALKIGLSAAGRRKERMNRVRSEDLAVDRAIDRYGIHEVRGPLLVGGVDLLNTRTGLFCDNGLRHILTDEQRFRAYLEFREQAFQIAVTELMSGAESTVDMFLSIAADREQFGSHLVEYMLPCTRHDGISSIFLQSAIDRDGPNGSEAEKLLRRRLYALQRYFALRRLLVKLDFIQLSSDPEDVIKRLKSSIRCPELQEDELSYSLKSHMNFLKKYVEKKMDPAYSISEEAPTTSKMYVLHVWVTGLHSNTLSP
ncbi:hypothetical protein BRADI_5g06120v3 [Brachypodium distachyon]|uniref:Uncharacterized protein n=1 Tax=Brachypodium distachyon TaxID=15368 RepID=A0A0Q3KQ92_BRADI|nr:hypothetical protein BRADI_5g06120v3 [Brachypodium distachyon]